MLTKRDEMLGKLTDHLSLMIWTGNFVGHDSGVSVVVHHRNVADMTWDELEASEDPVALAKERIAALAVE